MKKYLVAVCLLTLSACAGLRGHRINHDDAERIKFDIELEKYRNEYLRSHPNLSPIIYRAIWRGEARIGMSTDEVRASLGIPLSEQRSGSVAYWYYFQRLLVFREGVLIFFQK